MDESLKEKFDIFGNNTVLLFSNEKINTNLMSIS